MSKDTCIKANTYCPVHKGIVGADCWHDSKDFSVPRTDWKQVDEINTLREQVEKLEALVVMRCDLDVPPQFSQGLQSHEVLDPVTAEHCQWFVAKIEKLTKERDWCGSRNWMLRSELAELDTKLAALAEQNAKMREALETISCNLGTGKLRSISEKLADDALSLPDLASPVLNSIPKEPTLPVFDADSPRFRQVFDEAVQAHNLPSTRKGEGYRSPITQWCFEIAYSVVNRLRLYEK